MLSFKHYDVYREQFLNLKFHKEWFLHDEKNLFFTKHKVTGCQEVDSFVFFGCKNKDRKIPKSKMHEICITRDKESMTIILVNYIWL